MEETVYMLSVFYGRVGTFWLWFEFTLLAPRPRFASAYSQARSWHYSLLLACLMAIFGVSLHLSGNIRARGHDLTTFLWHVLWSLSGSSSTYASTFWSISRLFWDWWRFSLVDLSTKRNDVKWMQSICYHDRPNVKVDKLFYIVLAGHVSGTLCTGAIFYPTAVNSYFSSTRLTYTTSSFS